LSAPDRKVSKSAVRRLSRYLRALDELVLEGEEVVSSGDLAHQAGTTAAQVRKDLSLFGSFGKRGLGYEVTLLRRLLREIMGLTRRWRVALVGAGRIGAALFEYPPFRERGFEIVAIFDNDSRKIGGSWGGVSIQAVDCFEETLRAERVEIVILAVPGGVAQEIAERVAGGGVRGILNFAPVRIQLPEGFWVSDVNMTVEMETLSYALWAARAEEG
jgi:redox-sensing transcriptional repressor